MGVGRLFTHLVSSILWVGRLLSSTGDSPMATTGSPGDDEKRPDALDTIDGDDYSHEYIKRCPKDGFIMPAALPYTTDVLSADIEGYHLVCPFCRHVFEEYQPSNEDWMGR